MSANVPVAGKAGSVRSTAGGGSTTGRPVGANKKRTAPGARRESLYGMLLILPTVLVIAVLIIAPLVYVFWDSLHDRSFIGTSDDFVGLGNYIQILTSSTWWQIFGNSAIWTVASVVLQIAIGLGLAILLNQRIPARGLLRGLYLLPWVTPVVVVVLIWKWMLNDLYGIINSLLGLINPALHQTAWFSQSSLALMTVIGINVWRGVPFTMIIFLAGLQTVPQELKEAVSIDGGGVFRSFWNVTVPHLRSILMVVILVFTLFNFNNFDLIYLATQGGPVNLTMTLPVQTYQVGFGQQQIGQASAWAVLMLVTVLILGLIYALAMRRRERQS